jgi:SAM-dependent methyltransferase
MNLQGNLDPLIYHQHHSDKLEDIPFWSDLARNAGGPILELGCGTGRVIAHLAQLGQRIIGLDSDYGMLVFLKENLPSHLLGMVDIFQAGLENFQLERKFPLIILACNTLSTLKKEKREMAFLRVGEHLSEGGLFAASVPNPMILGRLPDYGEPEIEEVISHPISGHPLQISSEWERKDRSVLFRWHYDHLIPDGQVERYTVEVEHTINGLDDYKAKLQAADLKPVEFLGDFDRSNFNHNSPHLILLAQKG